MKYSDEHHQAGRPGIRYRYTARAWNNMTPEQLAKSGSEHGHQRAFFADLQTRSPLVNDMTFSIPNGASTGGDALGRAIQGGKLKAEGLKRGVPDVFVAWPYGGYSGLFIEMKKPKKGVASKEQLEWHGKLRLRGYKVVIAPHWQLAMNEVGIYFQWGTIYDGGAINPSKQNNT